ncbi:cyclin-dependent kinase inhibitor 1D [Aplochiton taeniatus]
MEMADTSSTPSSSESLQSHVRDIEDLQLSAGPVRRNLFGPVDHHQLKLDFQKLLNMNVEVANKRWNFDFQADLPANGTDVEWEEIKSRDVPAFYRSCVVKREGPVVVTRDERLVAAAGRNSQEANSSPGSLDEYLEVTTRECYRIQRPEKIMVSLKAVKRRQSSIKDFFSVKKRRYLHHKGPSRQ